MTCPAQISVFAHARDAEGALSKARTYAWPELCAAMPKWLDVEAADQDRRNLPMWVPAIWRGERRCKANVAAVTLAVLDLDGIPQVELDRVVTALTPYQAMIYSSPRDPMPDGKRKVRVIAAIDTAVLPEDSPRLKQALAKALSVENDPTTEPDAARGYFVGRLQGTAPRQLWVSPGSAPLQVQPLLATVPAAPSRTFSDADLPDSEGEADALVGAIPPKVIEILAETFAASMQPGQKNALIYALGGTLRQWGWSINDAEELARQALDRRAALAGDVDSVEDGVDTLHRAYYVANPHGWDKVKGLIGPQLAATIEAHTPNRWNAAKKAYADIQAHPWIQEQRNAAQAEAQAREILSKPLPLPPTPGFDPRRYLPEAVELGWDVMGPGHGGKLDTLIRGIEIAPGYATALVGQYGTSKTPFAIKMGLCLANGIPWHNRTTQHCEVIYLAAEKPFGLQDKRIRIARGLGVDPLSMHLMRMPSLQTDGKPNVDAIMKLGALVTARAAKTGRKVVVMLDTYAASVSGLEHNASEFAVPWALFVTVLRNAGAAVLSLLHARKPTAGSKNVPPDINSAEGNQGIMNAADAGIALWRPDMNDRHFIQMICIRDIRNGSDTVNMRWIDRENEGNPEWALLSEDLPVEDECPEVKAPETPESERARVLKAGAQFVRSVFPVAPGSITTIQAMSLEAVALSIAESVSLPVARVKGLLKSGRIENRQDDTTPTEAMPFCGAGDKLELRHVNSTPTGVFNGQGAGYQAVDGPPRLPDIGPPRVPVPQNMSLLSAVENARVAGYEGPAGDLVLRAGLPWPEDPIGRRDAMNRLRAALGPGDTLEPGQGQRRPAWLTINPKTGT